MKSLFTGLVIGLAAFSTMAEESGLPVLTPEQLDNYQFETPAPKRQLVVEDLSVGQKFTLDGQRREVRDLIARHLGIVNLYGDAQDLKALQQLYDRNILKPEQVREWQAVGVVFGDILAKEFGLHWVSYEDELGASRALRWRNSDNFVFPVTMFSKRLQFGEKIDVEQIFNSIKADVERIKALPDPSRG